MAKEKKPVHKVVMTEGKRNIIRQLLQEYDIETTEDIQEALERVTAEWTPKYPNSMKCWKDKWDSISPIFKFSSTVRKVIYTTNAIKRLNAVYRNLIDREAYFRAI